MFSGVSKEISGMKWVNCENLHWKTSKFKRKLSKVVNRIIVKGAVVTI